jgi:redox-sensitive bicupin YhaK (pirin superfamily)
MIEIRNAKERGHADHGWLDSHHSFSFADYYDPRFMGFRQLRVINEDRVQPGKGFGTHPHRDMEIISYVLDGALAHKDSMGNGSTIRPGEVQRMSAGTGVTHSEFNHSPDGVVHFLQIWIVPEKEGLPPSYEQRTFPESERQDRLRLVAARDGREGAVTIHQDVDVYAALLRPKVSVVHSLRPGRHGWIQVARGAISVNGNRLVAGDGAAVSNEASLNIEAIEPSEVLLFDLA